MNNTTIIKYSPSFNIRQIINRLYVNRSENIMLQFPNTSYIDMNMLRELEKYQHRVSIQVVGGFDEKRIHDYPRCSERLTRDNVYSVSEMKKIMYEIKQIEDGINPNWDEMQKLVYLVDKLGSRIIYHPFFEDQPSRDIRSLRGLYSGKTVCAGYSIILKELCDRNHIKCDYVEGCTNQEDCDKDYLTHAWNIVNINGYNIPVDLTWHAGKARRGGIMALENIGNVNAFVNSHFPGKHERIQYYRNTLTNVDGVFLKKIHSIVNKDGIIRNRIFSGSRKDGTKFIIAQDSTFLKDNEYFIRYFYYDIDQNNNISSPIVLYSKTNISAVVQACGNIKKLRRQLAKANQRGDRQTAQEIREKISSMQSVEAANDLIDNLLLSKENIRQAVRRGDYYIGSIKSDTDEDGKKIPIGVEINLNHAKKVSEYEQRTYKRSDGTTFVLQEVKPLDFNGHRVHRYFMYEGDGTKVLKNMIFSDEDLIHDYRKEIPDKFLSRSRIDRKQKETNGYLGYLAKDNVCTNYESLNNYFSRDLAVRNHFDDRRTTKYIPDVTFVEMSNLAKVYEFDINGKIVNKNTGRELTNPDMIPRVGFALAWLHAAGSKIYVNEPVPGYRYAFGEPSEKVFDIIYEMITDSVNKYGNINPSEILKRIREECLYKYGEDIVTKLFGNGTYTNLINKLFRQQNPSAVSEKHIEHFTTRGFTTDAYQKLAEYERQKERELRNMLEVVDDNGTIRVVKKVS